MSATSHNRKPHVVPLTTYLAVGVALFILTGLTVGVSMLDLGGWNAVAAFTIAAIKTALVAFFFMHLWWDNRLYFLVFLAGIAFLAVFIAFTMFDVLQRGELNEISGGPIQKDAVIYQKQADSTTMFDSLADTTASVTDPESQKATEH